MGLTMKPTSRDWPAIAITLLAAFTAFVTAWQAFAGNDAKQDARLANIERLLCTTDEPARMQACRMSGVKVQ
jgi:hypothetical protein